MKHNVREADCRGKLEMCPAGTQLSPHFYTGHNNNFDNQSVKLALNSGASKIKIWMCARLSSHVNKSS